MLEVMNLSAVILYSYVVTTSVVILTLYSWKDLRRLSVSPSDLKGYLL